ncbi:MMPL family transporter [Actinomadura sp. 9N215]|uniref:MMPL family transporter n=1 Tax=Actinomadura sp. 9N215 TaxID=3375150 RepID=UPI0037A91BB5
MRGAPVRVTGMDALFVRSSEASGPGVLAELTVAGVGALAVLAIVFGSALAVLPLLMAAIAILACFLAVWGVTAVADVSFVVQFLIALIGLGVAIDYALLITTRWREERARGADEIAVVERAMTTAGSAVVFSGVTVAIALAALVVLPVPFLRSQGYGGCSSRCSACWSRSRCFRSSWPRPAPASTGPASAPASGSAATGGRNGGRGWSSGARRSPPPRRRRCCWRPWSSRRSGCAWARPNRPPPPRPDRRAKRSTSSPPPRPAPPRGPGCARPWRTSPAPGSAAPPRRAATSSTPSTATRPWPSR